MILFEDNYFVVYTDTHMQNYKRISIRNKRRDGVEVGVNLDPDNLSHILIHAVTGQMRVDVVNTDGSPGVRVAPGR